MENFPSKSVVPPSPVYLINTLANGRGSLKSPSIIEPLIVDWEKAN